eukprot:4258673-Pyramimonas_sp.AAC.1
MASSRAFRRTQVRFAPPHARPKSWSQQRWPHAVPPAFVGAPFFHIARPTFKAPPMILAKVTAWRPTTCRRTLHACRAPEWDPADGPT